jgi:hypothetical protein
MKDPIMNTQPQFEKSTPADVQKIVRQAHQMRSEYLAKTIKAGLSNLRRVFGHRKPVGNARA